MEDAANQETRTACSKRLRNIKTDEKYENWAVTFGNIFDKIFGEKHFSRERFLRSFVATYVFLIICLVTIYSLFTAYFKSFIGDISLIIIVLLLGVILAIIPYYLSLIQTRYFIKLLEKPRNKIIILLVLILDVISTYILFLFFLVIVPNLLSLASFNGFTKEPFLTVFTLDYFKGLTGRKSLAFLLPTFFTSIWLYFYLFSSWVIKYFKFFTKRFDIENKPFKSLGLVSVSTVFVIYLIAVPFVLSK